MHATAVGHAKVGNAWAWALVAFTLVGMPIYVNLARLANGLGLILFALIAFVVISTASSRDERRVIDAGYVPISRIAWLVPAVYLTARWTRTRSGAFPTVIAVVVVALPLAIVLLDQH